MQLIQTIYKIMKSNAVWLTLGAWLATSSFYKHDGFFFWWGITILLIGWISTILTWAINQEID